MPEENSDIPNNPSSVPPPPATPNPKARARVKEARAKTSKPKLQYTVRIDSNLARSVLAWIKKDNMRLTDAMEQGLWLWIQERASLSDDEITARFIWSTLPADMRETTTELWAYLAHDPIESAHVPILRRMIRDELRRFRRTPAYQVALKKLATPPAKSGDELE